MKKLILVATLFSVSDAAAHFFAALLGGVRHAAPVLNAAARLSGPSYRSGSYDDLQVPVRAQEQNQQQNQPQVQRSQSPQPQPRRLTVNRVRQQAPPPPAAVPAAQANEQAQIGEQVAPQLQAAAAAAAPSADPAPVANAKSYIPYWVVGSIIVVGGVYWLNKKYQFLKKLKSWASKKKLKAKPA